MNGRLLFDFESIFVKPLFGAANPSGVDKTPVQNMIAFVLIHLHVVANWHDRNLHSTTPREKKLARTNAIQCTCVVNDVCSFSATTTKTNKKIN